MSGPTGRVRYRRGAAAVALLTGLAVAITLPGWAGERDARAQAAPGAVHVQPQLGPAFDANLIGSAPQGTSGDPAEAWAYRVAGSRVSPPRGGAAPLEYGGEEQLVLMRYTSAEGWRHVETPLTTSGAPYHGGAPQGGRVTARGGVVIATNDPSQGRRLLVRDPGVRMRAAPLTPPSVVRPQEGSLPAERLSLDAIAASEEAGRTTAYAAIEGRQPETGVARWDGSAWSRESICVAIAGAPPAGCSPGETFDGSTLDTVAIAAAGGRAWLLADDDLPGAPSGGRGLVLFERVSDGAGPRWRLRSISEPLFEQASTPARAVESVEPLTTPHALTATDAGVWLDGEFQVRGVPTSVTMFFDGSGSTTWCDGADAAGPLCDHPLGARLGGRCYRSIAWPGPGAGSRVMNVASQVDNPAVSDEDYLTLEGVGFVRRPTFDGSLACGAAFSSPDEGWVGWSHITRAARGSPLASWPIPVRRPLTAIAGEPGHAPGSLAAGALAVGEDGTVLRYTPGIGWDSEQLLGSSGVSRANLRGVAWPQPDFAYAVGDEGAMWRWNRVTGLWESDPGAPFDFMGNLMAVAFQPGDPERGYAVGRAGVLLRYGKSWEQEQLPPEVQTSGPLGGPADLTSVAFAGSQALVAAGGHLLVNDGAGWRVDAQAQALIDSVENVRINSVAGLPDGGAVAAGRGVVLIRDSAGGPWRFADQPLPAQDVVAVAAFRESALVRALASIIPPSPPWPVQEEVDLPPVEPGAPPPRPGSFSLPTFGTLLRETASGWRDEERTMFRVSSPDKARKADPAAGLLVDAAGNGWVAGGWNGRTDGLGNGIDDAGAAEVMQTASISRYSPQGAEPAPAQRGAPIETAPGRARLLVGGHSRCDAPCAGRQQLELMPDRTLAHATARAAAWARQPHGPGAFLYTSGGEPQAGETQRVADLLRPATGAVPVFAAMPTAGGNLAPFAGFSAPFGAGGGQPLTHYAADVGTSAGTVRVVVIDNSAGSLAASDPQQNPPEAQEPWLRGELGAARARGVPVVVMGTRSLNRFEPDGSVIATDADQIAALLRDAGASAYVYDSPEAQRAATIPAGDPNGIPTFGSGTLGYRSAADSVRGFGHPGLLLLELNVAERNRATNRAPVGVRLIPVIEDLAIEAVDGRVLNRSQPALFRGLGRRPRSGNRPGAGGDPYVHLPNPACVGGCVGRIEPEARFASSDPDIANFVRQDPASSNPRKPFIDPRTDSTVADASSGLLCAFNAGTTTVSVLSGGLSYSTTVTVRGGSVLRPCGTVPLARGRFPERANPGAVGAPPPAPAQQQPNPINPEVVPPPPGEAAPPVQQTPSVPPAAAPTVPEALPNPAQSPPSNPVPLTSLPAIPPPRPATSARPIPPSGTSPVTSSATVYQPAAKVERQREDEEALEHQQSAARYLAEDRRLVGGLVLALVLGAALAGTAIRPRRRPGDRGERLARSYASTTRDHWR